MTRADTTIAPDGAIWVCGACGKTSRDRYGSDTLHWDESCMLNAVLCIEATLIRDAGGRVIKADSLTTKETTDD